MNQKNLVSEVAQKDTTDLYLFLFDEIIDIIGHSLISEGFHNLEQAYTGKKAKTVDWYDTKKNVVSFIATLDAYKEQLLNPVIIHPAKLMELGEKRDSIVSSLRLLVKDYKSTKDSEYKHDTLYTTIKYLQYGANTLLNRIRTGLSKTNVALKNVDYVDYYGLSDISDKDIGI
jgi:hypothetical protein